MNRLVLSTLFLATLLVPSLPGVAAVVENLAQNSQPQAQDQQQLACSGNKTQKSSEQQQSGNTQQT